MPTLQVAIDARAAKQGAQQFADAGRQIQGSATGIDRSVTGVHSSFISLRSVISALAGSAVVGFAGSAVKAFAEEEAATRRLTSALSLLGAGSDAAVDQHVAFAAEMQRITTVADDEVIAMQALGASLAQLEGQQLQQATKAAIGLSKALGMDTTSAMRLVARAAVGETAALSRYGIILDETLSPQERFNKLLEIGAKNFGLAEAEADTATGAMADLKNAWGDFMEVVGATILDSGVLTFLKELSSGIKSATDTIGDIRKFKEETGMSVWRDAAFYGQGRTYIAGPPRNTADPEVLARQAKSQADAAAAAEVRAAREAAAEVDRGRKFESLMNPLEDELRIVGLLSEGRTAEAEALKREYEWRAKVAEISKQMSGLQDGEITALDMHHKRLLREQQQADAAAEAEKRLMRARTAAADAMRHAADDVEILKRQLADPTSLRGFTTDIVEFERVAEEAFGHETPEYTANIEAFKDSLRELERLDRLTQIADSIGQSFADAFDRIVFESQNAGEAMKQFGEEVARMLFRKLILDQVANAIAGGIGMAFKAPTPAPTANTYGAADYAAGFRSGGVFANGQVIPFAGGGIISSPSYFGMSGGRTGLMGEAGPEAILPLKRGPSGDLGVAASGGGGGVVEINIINNTGEKVSTREDQGPGGKSITVMIGEAMAADVTGNGALGRAITSTYGLKRRGIQRG